ncbi:hypothetical protein O7607_18475 [Micromonospora sp. WMMA1949]|uniref:hypothetical protein n=1 Tax=unclassified Micromonospora TaxID=2617518 RepID=UPI0022B67219|nr:MULTISPECIES: hypothetical protein [unclassified Micromonospora]MCZ7427727.1 hypothetical protein [Micromonospora sp. WMMA1949]WBC06651.1 hypothetical protein O7604_15420 [Micromonospora sp. WMMA1947]
MPTDIYGFFEVRHPHADADWHGRESWLCMMPLSPLYDDGDYTAFGCLFGVRNWLGWEPVAAGRGLPAEVSSPVRADYDEAVRMDAAIHGATWVSWAELRDLDMSVPPAACGVLRVHEAPGLIRQFRVVDEWPAEVVGKYGVPPVGTSPAEVTGPLGRSRGRVRVRADDPAGRRRSGNRVGARLRRDARTGAALRR